MRSLGSVQLPTEAFLAVSSWTSRREREHLRLALGAPQSGGGAGAPCKRFAGGENLGAGAIHLP